MPTQNVSTPATRYSCNPGASAPPRVEPASADPASSEPAPASEDPSAATPTEPHGLSGGGVAPAVPTPTPTANATVTRVAPARARNGTLILHRRSGHPRRYARCGLTASDS